MSRHQLAAAAAVPAEAGDLSPKADRAALQRARARLRRLAGRVRRRMDGAVTAAEDLARVHSINLALQGGGAHGAFTWGVLDRLLEERSLRFDGVSGTSAGAVNAVALAAGLMEDGYPGAREKLANVWHSVSRAGASLSSPLSLLTGGERAGGWGGLGRSWSPYDLNPLDINPLRDILEARIDFNRLRHASPVKLFIAATEVSTGRARIFRERELTVDCVLASACLPTLFAAIKIGRFHYWDGGFSANPDLITLISESAARDTLLVQLNPHRDPKLPLTSDEIAGNVNRITFNQPLRREIEVIERSRRAAGGTPTGDARSRALARHRFHLIEAERHTGKLSEQSKLSADWQLLSSLHDAGREEAETWLESTLSLVGRRSSVDLYDKFFESRLPFD